MMSFRVWTVCSLLRASLCAVLVLTLLFDLLVVSSGASAAVRHRDQPVLATVQGSAWRVRAAGGRRSWRTSWGRGDVPLLGDWNGDGRPTPAFFREGIFTLRHRARRGRGSRVRFGRPFDRPIVGDWDGDGREDLGVRRRGRWLLNIRPFGRRPDLVVRLGRGSDRPVVGDWDGDGQDTLGVVRNDRWVLHDDLRARGRAEHDFRFGKPSDVPVVGAWRRRRPDRPGFVRSGVWYLRATVGSGGSVRKVRFGGRGDWFVTAGAVGLGPTWDRLATCESGGRWGIATGNGYYGGLQFSLRSWRAVGGRGYPHHASRRRQIHHGQRLRRLQGWGAWPVCSRRVDLR